MSAIAVDHATKPGEKYLHRSETGDPDHHPMNTHFDMNNNNLNRVDTVNSRVVNASDLVDTHRVRADIGDISTVNAIRVHVKSSRPVGVVLDMRLSSNGMWRQEGFIVGFGEPFHVS